MLLVCSAHAMSGFLRGGDGDELSMHSLAPAPLLPFEDYLPGIPTSASGGRLPPILPSPSLIQTHVPFGIPGEDERIMRAMDVNHDSVISSSELEQAIQKGHVPDSVETPVSLLPGQATARFFLSLRSSTSSTMRNVREVRVAALEPTVATASFRAMPMVAGGRGTVNGVQGQQHLGGFMQKQFSQNLAAELQVKCECHAPGIARFQVVVALQGGGSGGESFRFDKTCRGDQLRGVDVGTTPFGKDVVEDGISSWSPSHLPVVEYNRSTISLYVAPSLLRSLKEVSFQSPHVRVWDMEEPDPTASGNSKVADNSKQILQAQLVSALGSGDGKLNSSQPTELTVDFRCLKPTTAIIEVMLVPKLVWDPFKPISIFLKKECFGGIKKGFHVGVVKGAKNLVRDGRVQSQVADVDSHQGSSQFFVEYSPAGPSDVDQHVRPVLHCSDEERGGRTSVVHSQLFVKDAGKAYSVTYNCRRPGVSVCTLSLGLKFYKSVDLHWRKTCGGHAADVMVESSFVQSESVFGGGEAAAMWELANPTISLKPDTNVAVFTVRSSPGVAKGAGALPYSMLSPRVDVSDAKVLDVIVSKETEFKGSSAPLVFIARHVCKQRGTSKVTIMLPRSKASSDEAGEDPLDQVAFAYRKVCAHPVGGLSFFGLHTGLHSLSRWDVPTGGWRVLLGVAIVLVLGVICHEFGHKWLSKFILQEIKEKMGPDVFGVEIEIGSLSFRPWSGVFVMHDFRMLNPKNQAFEHKYLLKASKVHMLTAPKKFFYTFGQVADIMLLRLEDIDVQIEFPGVFATSNIAVVREHVNQSFEAWENETNEKQRKGEKPSMIAAFFNGKLHAWIHEMLDHALLHRAEFINIRAIATHPLLGGELDINDIHFADFSTSYNAVGVRAIANQLADAFYRALQQDALGETGAQVADASESAKKMINSRKLSMSFDGVSGGEQ